MGGPTFRPSDVASWLRAGLAECVRLRSSLDDSRAVSLRMAQFIMSRPRGQPDHACAQCVPGGEVNVLMFVCGYHVALALVELDGDQVMATRRR